MPGNKWVKWALILCALQDLSTQGVWQNSAKPTRQPVNLTNITSTDRKEPGCFSGHYAYPNFMWWRVWFFFVNLGVLCSSSLVFLMGTGHGNPRNYLNVLRSAYHVTFQILLSLSGRDLAVQWFQILDNFTVGCVNLRDVKHDVTLQPAVQSGQWKPNVADAAEHWKVLWSKLLIRIWCPWALGRWMPWENPHSTFAGVFSSLGTCMQQQSSDAVKLLSACLPDLSSESSVHLQPGLTVSIPQQFKCPV